MNRWVAILLLLCAGCSVAKNSPPMPRHSGQQKSAVRAEAAPVMARSAAVIAAPIVPAVGRTIRAAWDFPRNLETPDLVFNFYSTGDLTVPMIQWPLFTVVPGTNRSTILPAEDPQRFFVMTASNYLGESSFSFVTSTTQN